MTQMTQHDTNRPNYNKSPPRHVLHIHNVHVPNVTHNVLSPFLDHFIPSSLQGSATKRTTLVGVVRLLRAGGVERVVTVCHRPYLIRCDGLPTNGAVEDRVVNVPLA